MRGGCGCTASKKGKIDGKEKNGRGNVVDGIFLSGVSSGKIE